MAKSTSKDQPISESKETTKWRETELLSYGFTEDQTKQLLTIPGLNTTTVRERLIKRGCSAELAYRILS